MKKCGMRDSREKGAGMRDQDPPPPLPPDKLPDPVTKQGWRNGKSTSLPHQCGTGSTLAPGVMWSPACSERFFSG